MELNPKGVCIFCKQKTAVLIPPKVAPYLKYVEDTFFNCNKVGLQKFQNSSARGSLCVLCAHKVAISFELKSKFEDMCKQNISFKVNPKACFLCKSKLQTLIATKDNPNDFDKKIQCFMDSTLHQRSYKECSLCFNCLFCLDIWFEIKLNIKDKSKDTTAPNSRLPQNENIEANCISPSSFSKEKTTRSTTANRNLRTSTKSIKPPIIPKSKKSLKKRKKTVFRNVLNITRTNGNKYKSSYKTHRNELKLKSTLKHLTSVQNLDTNTLGTQIDDKKILSAIPYVIMIQDNRCMDSKMSGRRVGKRTTPKKQSFAEYVAVRKSSRLRRNETIVVSDSASCCEVSDDSSSSSDHATSINTCRICDQTFTSLCSYKSHELWHQKPEAVVINVKRSNLLVNSKATEVTNGLKKIEKKKKPASNIKNVLQKYVACDSDTSGSDSDTCDPNSSKDRKKNLELTDETTENREEETGEKSENEKEQTDDDTTEKQVQNEKEQSDVEETDEKFQNEGERTDGKKTGKKVHEEKQIGGKKTTKEVQHEEEQNDIEETGEVVHVDGELTEKNVSTLTDNTRRPITDSDSQLLEDDGDETQLQNSTDEVIKNNDDKKERVNAANVKQKDTAEKIGEEEKIDEQQHDDHKDDETDPTKKGGNSSNNKKGQNSDEKEPNTDYKENDEDEGNSGSNNGDVEDQNSEEEHSEKNINEDKEITEDNCDAPSNSSDNEKVIENISDDETREDKEEEINPNVDSFSDSDEDFSIEQNLAVLHGDYLTNEKNKIWEENTNNENNVGSINDDHSGKINNKRKRIAIDIDEDMEKSTYCENNPSKLKKVRFASDIHASPSNTKLQRDPIEISDI